MRASSRADSISKRRSSVSSASVVSASCAQLVSTRSTIRRRRRAAPSTVPMKPISSVADERRAERREGRLRKARAHQQRGHAGAAALVQDGPHPRLAHAGQLGEREFEHVGIARQQRPQDQPRGQLTGLAQVTHQRAQIVTLRSGGDVHGRTLAGVAAAISARSALSQLRAVTKSIKRAGEFCHQRQPGRGRQFVALEQLLADRGDVAEALDDAIERDLRQLGVRILEQARQASTEPTSAIAAQIGVGSCERAAQPRTGSRTSRWRRCRRDQRRSAAGNVRGSAARRKPGRSRARERSPAAHRRYGRRRSPSPRAPAATDRRAASAAPLRSPPNRRRTYRRRARPGPGRASLLRAHPPEPYEPNQENAARS